MATLYAMTDEYADLLAQLDVAETDEERDAIWAQIDAVEDNIVDKADAYAKIMRTKQAEAEMYKAEKERLAKAQKAAENAVEHLKSRMLDAMKLMNMKDMPTSIGKWRRQMNPFSCTITDAAAVPERYHIPQPDKIDSRAIINDYKLTGEIIDGVEVTRKEGVRFQ